MQVLISCVGSAGDVHPFLAIGQTLARRGHAVEVMASPHFQARIESAGLGFHPFGTEVDYQRVVRCADLWSPRHGFDRLWREMQPQLLAAHDALVACVRDLNGGPTVLVGSTLAWHVRLAQETQQLPGATVHLSPMCMFSALAPAHRTAAGSPQALAPFAHDQFDNTARWVERGLGLRLPAGHGDWAPVLGRLVGEPQIAAACTRYAALMGPLEAANQRATDLIESLA